jgi:hypothetical protein
VTLKSPYPYFGGKSTVAPIVWRRLGNVKNYIEPFFGSGAMLLARPDSQLSPRLTETVNDKDGFVANFWRAIQADPDSVAEYADWPINENDLHARHVWLVSQRESLTVRLEGDPGYHDTRIAGWWAWGMSCWLGGGFCSGEGPWKSIDGKLTNSRESDGAGVRRKSPKLQGEHGIHTEKVQAAGVERRRPQLHNEMGIHADRVTGTGVAGQLPYLKGNGQGVKRQRVDLSEKGIRRQAPRLSANQGVNRQLPELKSDRGVHRDHSGGIFDYFAQLQNRLRRVRVCSGDWSRITGPSVTTGNGLTGVFLDPPYAHDQRDPTLYALEDGSLAAQVRAWAITNGDNPLLRIAYCGYEDGFVWPESWTVHHWRANGGYANQGDGQGRKNKARECIWFSPHCLPEATQQSLFDAIGA